MGAPFKIGCAEALFSLFVFVSPAYSAGKFVPPDGQVLLIIGQDKNSIKHYVQATKAIPGGFACYTAIQDVGALRGPHDVGGGGIQDLPYLLKKYPNAVIQVGLYMVNALDGVLRGAYDKNIEKMAEIFKRAKRPIYLRIGYEFDNPENGYDPPQYVSAYHYIVDKLRGLQVTNVAYVWHSYAVTDIEKPIMLWYPGDDYVDWVAISYFSPYNTDGMNAVAQMARDHAKPFMIAEASPFTLPTSKGEYTWKRWFDFVFKYIREQDVKIFCYINCYWDYLPQFATKGWGDARVEMNPEIKMRWLDMIGQKTFLQYAPDLSKKLNYE